MDRASRAAAWVPVAAVATCCALCLAEPLFTSSSLYARDVSILYWPTREFAAQAVSSGHLPQWDPRAQSGIPFFGNLHTGVLYPPYLLHLLLPFAKAYAWFVFLHQVLGGAGMLVLLRRLGIGRPASLGGALAFVLSGCVVGMVNTGPLIAGASLVPWVLACLTLPDLVWKRGALAGFAVSAQVFAGDPQAVLYSLLAAAGLIAWHPDRGRIARATAMAFSLAAVLSAVQLIPAWLVFEESDRVGFTKQFLSEFAMHPARVLELFAPFPFGAPATEPGFWGSAFVRGPGKWPFVLSAYLGAAATAFAAAGATRNRIAGFGASVAAAGLLLALGPHAWVGRLVLPLAPFRFFRYPEKYLFLVALGAAILAAIGIERVLAGTARARRLGFLSAAWVAAAATVWGILASDSALEGLLALASVRRVAVHTARETLAASLGQALSFSALVLLAAWIARWRPHLRAALAWVAPLAVAADLLGPARALAFTAPPELYSEPPLAAAMRAASPLQPSRFMRESAIDGAFSASGARDAYLRERAHALATLHGDVGGLFGLEEVRGYGASFSLARWNAVALALYARPERLSALWNGCLLIGKLRGSKFDGREGLVAILADAELGIRVYRNERCLPRLRAVARTRAAGDLAGAVRALAAPELPLADEAIVEGGVDRQYAPATLKDVTVAREQAGATVEAGPGGAFVVFASPWSRGWTARIDGQAAPTSIANGAQLGVAVPEGAHRIELVYSTPGLAAGALVSLLGLLVGAGALAWSRRGRGAA